MSSRKFGRNAFESGLDGGITAGATTIDLDSATGLTAPGYLTLEPENPTKREYILYTGISTNQLTGVTRGLAGSAAGAQAHDSGVIARVTFVHQLLDDVWTDIEALETGAAGHYGGTDTADHPEATTSVRGFLSAADKTKLDGLSADHGLLSGLGDDDHPQYLNEARHDADDHSSLPEAAVTAHEAALSILESQISDLDHTDADAIHDNVQGEIDAVTLKGTPVADDIVLIEDSEGSFIKRKATVSSISSVGTTTDHGVLSGLGDNDHPQYAQLAGASFSGDVDPNADNSRDLGNATNSWRDIYVHAIKDESGNTIVNTSGRVLDAGTWTVDGNFEPNSEGTRHLGSSSRAWANVYAQNLYDEGGSQRIDTSVPRLVGQWDTSGHFEPSADNTYDLGDATFTWRRLYSHDIYNQAGTRVIDLANLVLDGGAWQIDNPSTTTNSGLAGWRHDQFDGVGPFDLLPLVSSSRRHKKNIRDADLEALAAEIDQLRLREWKERKHITTSKHNKWVQGAIAEEVVEFAPDRVVYRDGRPEGLDIPMAFAVPIIAKLKLMSAQLDELVAAA